MTKLEKVVITLMIVCAILFVVSLGFMATALDEMANNDGLRAFVEKFWCGKSGC